MDTKEILARQYESEPVNLGKSSEVFKMPGALEIGQVYVGTIPPDFGNKQTVEVKPFVVTPYGCALIEHIESDKWVAKLQGDDATLSFKTYMNNIVSVLHVFDPELSHLGRNISYGIDVVEIFHDLYGKHEPKVQYVND